MRWIQASKRPGRAARHCSHALMYASWTASAALLDPGSVRRCVSLAAPALTSAQRLRSPPARSTRARWSRLPPSGVPLWPLGLYVGRRLRLVRGDELRCASSRDQGETNALSRWQTLRLRAVRLCCCPRTDEPAAGTTRRNPSWPSITAHSCRPVQPSVQASSRFSTPLPRDAQRASAAPQPRPAAARDDST